VDSVAPGADFTDRMCMWEPGGPDWKSNVRTHMVHALVGAEIQSQDPRGLAGLWARILGIPVQEARPGEPEIPLQNGVLRFVSDLDGRGPGVGGFDVRTADRGRLVAAAEERGCERSDEHVVLCGARIRLL
jgi:hypothetical protein